MSTTSVSRSTAALAVEDLEVAYVVRGIDRAVLRGVSFAVGCTSTLLGVAWGYPLVVKMF